LLSWCAKGQLYIHCLSKKHLLHYKVHSEKYLDGY
jgi:hypothetical protein